MYIYIYIYIYIDTTSTYIISIITLPSSFPRPSSSSIPFPVTTPPPVHPSHPNPTPPHSKSLRKAHVVGLAFSFSQAIMYLIYSVGFYFGGWLMENDGLQFSDLFKSVTIAVSILVAIEDVVILVVIDLY